MKESAISVEASYLCLPNFMQIELNTTNDDNCIKTLQFYKVLPKVFQKLLAIKATIKDYRHL